MYKAYNNMLNSLSDNVTDVPGYNHVMKNNLSYAARTYETQHIDTATCDISYNSFTLPMLVRKSDFIRKNPTQLVASRKSDGSLPDVNLLKLKANSKLIDQGVDVGVPFMGESPDLGVWEKK